MNKRLFESLVFTDEAPSRLGTCKDVFFSADGRYVKKVMLKGAGISFRRDLMALWWCHFCGLRVALPLYVDLDKELYIQERCERYRGAEPVIFADEAFRYGIVDIASFNIGYLRGELTIFDPWIDKLIYNGLMGHSNWKYREVIKMVRAEATHKRLVAMRKEG